MIPSGGTRISRADYDRFIDLGVLWPDDHIELIDGQILQAPPKTPRFATALGLSTDALRGIVGSDRHLRIQAPLALEPDSEPEPDLAIVDGDARDFIDAHPTVAVLIVEVSESSLAFDRTWKGSLYARAGIPEYWIINLQARRLEVYRDPAPDPAAPLGWSYRQRQTFGRRERVAPLALPSAMIAVRDLLPGRPPAR